MATRLAVVLAGSLLAIQPVVAAAAAAPCSLPSIPFSGNLNIGEGYTARVITNKMYKPRQLTFDAEGNLLVVEAGRGITALKLKDNGGDCVAMAERSSVIADTSLNHAIQLTPDNKRLFASSADKVFSWAYDAKTAKTTGASQTWVTGMWNTDHSSRTILLPKHAPGKMLVVRGSASNIDYQARQPSSGHCQIRMFDISGPVTSAPFATGGTMVAMGLRNSVGLGENPTDGGIWSNENGSDNMSRDGKDIHENSPGEEINFHGFVNGTKHANFGKNFGYPDCAAAWHVNEMPRNSALKVGRHFSLTGNDTACGTDAFVPPRLTLPSHWAPIDIAFNSGGTVAYMTSRGSWNKRAPDGYKLFAISFEAKTGQPIHPPSSQKAAISVLENSNNSMCPGRCIRPTGVTFGPGGRLYVASERSGEIFVIGRKDGKSVDETILETAPPAGAAERVVEMEDMEPEGDELLMVQDADKQQLERPWLVRARSASPWNLLWNIFGSVAMRA